ncbi:hypothetical protein D5018_16740 [Parashewanella curva]|uniref:Uncharacterized protein n=1 Tax=Parashewanella curva TaxID=2338552 RepID=A0A3L8PT18_9GAMM|nr:hypothetical protein [Parashewanella curva]RLV58541.1 hypothetical protein D5018_16740 [Parashewanella curva]
MASALLHWLIPQTVHYPKEGLFVKPSHEFELGGKCYIANNHKGQMRLFELTNDSKQGKKEYSRLNHFILNPHVGARFRKIEAWINNPQLNQALISNAENRQVPLSSRYDHVRSVNMRQLSTISPSNSMKKEGVNYWHARLNHAKPSSEKRISADEYLTYIQTTDASCHREYQTAFKALMYNHQLLPNDPTNIYAKDNEEIHMLMDLAIIAAHRPYVYFILLEHWGRPSGDDAIVFKNKKVEASIRPYSIRLTKKHLQKTHRTAASKLMEQVAKKIERVQSPFTSDLMPFERCCITGKEFKNGDLIVELRVGEKWFPATVDALRMQGLKQGKEVVPDALIIPSNPVIPSSYLSGDDIRAYRQPEYINCVPPPF